MYLCFVMVPGRGQVAKRVSARPQVEAVVRSTPSQEPIPAVSWMKGNKKSPGQGIKTARCTAWSCYKPAA